MEERLNFFETGAAPSKNADAMRKVLESLDIDDDESDEEMHDVENIPLTLLEPSPSKKKEKKEGKEKKKEKKDKKRKSDAMEVDEESADGIFTSLQTVAFNTQKLFLQNPQRKR